MHQTKRQPTATVFGASGFLGRHVVRHLAAQGYRIRAACRRPDLAGHLQPLGTVGQIVPVQANLRHRWSIDRAVEGADVVINLVAILAESGRQTFNAVQLHGARWVADAAAKQNAALVHVSAIGADEASGNEYARTKGAAEREVLNVHSDARIIRPSVMFGPDDDFFNRFAAIARMSPVLPMIGGGKTRLQPVYVGDVAEAICRLAMGAGQAGQIIEAGGPEILSLRDCMEKMLTIIERKRGFLSVPFALASAAASVTRFLPGAPLTPVQVDLLRTDNVVSDEASHAGNTLGGLGISPRRADVILPGYLVRFRPHGQFEASRGL